MDCLEIIQKTIVSSEDLEKWMCLTLKCWYKLKEISMSKDNVGLSVKAGIADLIYRSHVADIFNELFMKNKNL